MHVSVHVTVQPVRGEVGKPLVTMTYSSSWLQPRVPLSGIDSNRSLTFESVVTIKVCDNLPRNDVQWATPSGAMLSCLPPEAVDCAKLTSYHDRPIDMDVEGIFAAPEGRHVHRPKIPQRLRRAEGLVRGPSLNNVCIMCTPRLEV